MVLVPALRGSWRTLRCALRARRAPARAGGNLGDPLRRALAATSGPAPARAGGNLGDPLGHVVAATGSGTSGTTSGEAGRGARWRLVLEPRRERGPGRGGHLEGTEGWADCLAPAGETRV